MKIKIHLPLVTDIHLRQARAALNRRTACGHRHAEYQMGLSAVHWQLLPETNLKHQAAIIVSHHQLPQSPPTPPRITAKSPTSCLFPRPPAASAENIKSIETIKNYQGPPVSSMALKPPATTCSSKLLRLASQNGQVMRKKTRAETRIDRVKTTNSNKRVEWARPPVHLANPTPPRRTKNDA